MPVTRKRQRQVQGRRNITRNRNRRTKSKSRKSGKHSVGRPRRVNGSRRRRRRRRTKKMEGGGGKRSIMEGLLYSTKKNYKNIDIKDPATLILGESSFKDTKTGTKFNYHGIIGENVPYIVLTTSNNSRMDEILYSLKNMREYEVESEIYEPKPEAEKNFSYQKLEIENKSVFVLVYNDDISTDNYKCVLSIVKKKKKIYI
jgi:hypothetical protein